MLLKKYSHLLSTSGKWLNVLFGCQIGKPTSCQHYYYCLRHIHHHHHQQQQRVGSSNQPSKPRQGVDSCIEAIRNVGLIAHIDAGKTTTTERMLYYARRTHYLGEVDDGDTVTDCLPEERERGISIVTAAASLSWRNHTIHLLDTPGHVDFTFEVERSLTVLDSVVIILDAVKGVQTQTHTVCRQAHRYNLPCVVYINKMDRPSANVDACLYSLSNQLPTKANYVPLHYPVFSHHFDEINAPSSPVNYSRGADVKDSTKSRFVGLVDLTTMELKAHRYNLPCVVYINKMDRPSANVDACLYSLSNQLPTKANYVPLHYPVFSHHFDEINAPSSPVNYSRGADVKDSTKSRFVGLVDLTTMELKNWISCITPDDEYISTNLLEGINTTTSSHYLHKPNHHSKSPNEYKLNTTEVIQQALNARMRLLSELAEIDEEFANEFLQLDRPDLLIPSDIVHRSLKKAVRSSRVIPVLIGSSRNNIGIQPLLDFIVDHFPDPSRCNLPAPVVKVYEACKSQLPNTNDLMKASHNNVDKHLNILSSKLPIMLVFKICFDPYRGPLTLVRVYSGVITPGCQITNWSRYNKNGYLSDEKILNIFQLSGDSVEVLNSAGPGSIVALSGLQSTYTGDILGPVLNTSNKGKQMEVQSPTDEEVTDSGTPGESLSLLTEVCEPVVYAAIEPGSRSEIRALEHALTCMQREDPSFHVKFDEETGQWTISGMGDLHLDVILARLKREYKVGVRMGPLLIAYKECPSVDACSSSGWNCTVGLINGSEKAVGVEIILQPKKSLHSLHKPQIIFDHHGDGKIARLRHAITEARLSALEVSGPILGSSIIGVDVHIHRIVCGRSEQIADGLKHIDNNNLNDLSLDKLSYAQLSSASLLALLKTYCIASLRDAVAKMPSWNLMEPMMDVELKLPAERGNALIMILYKYNNLNISYLTTFYNKVNL
uniref:Tr-type G domain-containing protein n=1 Tax=Trichobilharzia regenti TaxID=157069 RepID=A0AA85JP28_TRIRE|nr:unnamed protein product [Trichobilharzia regenti]